MIPLGKSYSQAGQDRWVYAMIVGPEKLYDGSFLDIGAGHPTELSNTFAIEKLGWRGLLVDSDVGSIDALEKERASPFILGDATKLPLGKLINDYIEGRPVDYLSLDVDSSTVDALINLLSAKVRFRVATIEHDSYRFGAEPKAEIERMMNDAGYHLVCEDVCSIEGLPFENWYCDPKTIPSYRYAKYQSAGRKWTDLFPP